MAAHRSQSTWIVGATRLQPDASIPDRPPAELAVRELVSPADLARVRPAWQRLFAACPGATPFQSPEWLLPWAQHFGGGGVWAPTAWRGERLVGLAPLWADAAAPRELLFLGQGITDYGGSLIAPGAEDATRALLERLADRAGRWDSCLLDQIPPGDALFSASLPPHLVESVETADVCPYVELPASVDALSAALPHRLGPRVQRSLRRLEREGPATFETAGAHNLEELLDGFFRLHADRWHARATPGVLADARLQAFHREVAAGMLAAGRLRLHAMRVRGRVEAVIYAFAHGRRLYSYLGGFSPELAAASPGSVMIWYAMAAAIDEGLDAFDFLRGAEAYKYRWGARDRWNRRRTLRPAA